MDVEHNTSQIILSLHEIRYMLCFYKTFAQSILKRGTGIRHVTRNEIVTVSVIVFQQWQHRSYNKRLYDETDPKIIKNVNSIARTYLSEAFLGTIFLGDFCKIKLAL